MTKKEISKQLNEAINLFNRRKNLEAEQIFLQILKKDSNNPQANYYLGLLYTKENLYPKAVYHLKAIIDLNVNFLFTQQCRMILGYIYYKNGNYSEACDFFLQVLDSKMEVLQASAAIAAVYYNMGDKDNALYYAEKAHNMDKFNINARNTYGFLLCDYEVDIDKGFDILRDVVRIKPNNPAYLDSLGWAYYKKGDIKEAISNLELAVKFGKNNCPEAREHIKMIAKKHKIPINV
jgi:tetratricopeptide (TPR) repeat protein